MVQWGACKVKTPFGIVRVGPHDVEICQMDESDARNNYGAYISEEHKIRLRPVFANRRQWAETLIHEIKHAIWDMWCINSKDGEERIVRTEALGWACVYRDNPVLMGDLVGAMAGK